MYSSWQRLDMQVMITNTSILTLSYKLRFENIKIQHTFKHVQAVGSALVL